MSSDDIPDIALKAKTVYKQHAINQSFSDTMEALNSRMNGYLVLSVVFNLITILICYNL